MNEWAGLAAFALALSVSMAGVAGEEKIAFPADYAANFVNYTDVDRADQKTVRKMYVNKAAAEVAAKGAVVPHGTVIVMEVRRAVANPAGEPILSANGRFQASNEVTAIFVMQKGPGWGAEYPAEKRNGEWEYAWFQPDGSRRANANYNGCFTCHKGQESVDYLFTAAQIKAPDRRQN